MYQQDHFSLESLEHSTLIAQGDDPRRWFKPTGAQSIGFTSIWCFQTLDLSQSEMEALTKCPSVNSIH